MTTTLEPLGYQTVGVDPWEFRALRKEVAGLAGRVASLEGSREDDREVRRALDR